MRICSQCESKPALSNLVVEPDCLEVWRTPLPAAEDELETMRAWLSHGERAHADRISTPRLRKDAVASRGILRLVLGRYLQVSPADVVLVQSSTGKPALSPAHGSTLRFNVSHSGDVLILAMANGREVGVDVEEIRPLDDLDALARRFLSPRQYQEVSRLPREERVPAVYELWVAKEAWLKAHGFGLSVDPRDLDFSAKRLNDSFRLIRQNVPSIIRLVSILPGYACAVTATGDAAWCVRLSDLPLV